MDPKTCPTCHAAILDTYFFCPNCGKKFKEPPVSTTLGKQITLYLISFLLPPFGLMPGIKYLMQENKKGKIIGFIAIFLTFLSIFISIWAVQSFMNMYTKTFDLQMQPYENLLY